MEMETGKLFIGGISWDTNEDRLREYFETFGDVVEAVIMKDRNTGRARGFGFVVYADPNVAERVVREKHMIDGRTVEAKKAVPRDDQNVLTRNSGSLTGSPGPIRTKKIFVGGLASTVTETDFRAYFDQFGTITDVVVMYDHNTQRPRGFGFITFDSEEAVEKVLLKTFHELNGKMVEVKRAVPKEQSPGPNRNQLGPGGYKTGLSRVSSLLNAYTQGYNIPSSIGGYGLRMEDRFSPVTVGRSGYSPFGPSSYGIGLNFEQALSPSYAGNGNFSPSIGSGRGLDPFHNGSPSRYNNNPMEYAGYGGGIGSLSGSTGHSLWGGGLSNTVPNSSNSNDFIGSRSGIGGLIGGSGTIGTIWGSSKISGEDGVTDPAFGRGNIDNNTFGFGRNSGNNTALTSPHATSSNALDGLFGNLYGGGSFYGDSTWRSSSPELDTSGPFDYGPGGVASDVAVKNSSRYVGGYSVNNGADRGIVT